MKKLLRKIALFFGAKPTEEEIGIIHICSKETLHYAMFGDIFFQYILLPTGERVIMNSKIIPGLSLIPREKVICNVKNGLELSQNNTNLH